MGTEIERKFLVAGTGWRGRGRATTIRQGYLSSVKERIVRVRTAGERAMLTIKGITVDATRSEFEYEIPPDEATIMLDELCERPLIEKIRHVVEVDGAVWEIDEFTGVNRGLVVAEIELEDEAQAVALPPWVGEEVTDDIRYYNSQLAVTPYSRW